MSENPSDSGESTADIQSEGGSIPNIQSEAGSIPNIQSEAGSDNLRRIEPFQLYGLEPNADVGDPPAVIWVDPRELLVDERYQRAIRPTGVKLIRRIIAGFRWDKFKAPTVVEVDAGYRVIDGQHTAIAAASHPGVNQIPVLLTLDRTLEEQAAAFIGINRDRVALTSTQLHRSAVVAADPEAAAIEAVCRRAGVKILANPPGSRIGFNPGETIAIKVIAAIRRRRGDSGLERILRILSTRAPVAAVELQALEVLMFDVDFRRDFDEAIVTAIARGSSDYDRSEAATVAATHGVTLYRALAVVWYRRVPKRTVAGAPQLRPRHGLDAIIGVPPLEGGTWEAEARRTPPGSAKTPEERARGSDGFRSVFSGDDG